MFVLHINDNLQTDDDDDTRQVVSGIFHEYRCIPNPRTFLHKYRNSTRTGGTYMPNAKKQVWFLLKNLHILSPSFVICNNSAHSIFIQYHINTTAHCSWPQNTHTQGCWYTVNLLSTWSGTPQKPTQRHIQAWNSCWRGRDKWSGDFLLLRFVIFLMTLVKSVQIEDWFLALSTFRLDLIW